MFYARFIKEAEACLRDSKSLVPSYMLCEIQDNAGDMILSETTITVYKEKVNNIAT